MNKKIIRKADETEIYHRHHGSNRDQEDFFRSVNIQFLVHELKGPLYVIETNTRMLLEFEKKFGRLTASQQKILQRSKRSAASLRNIVHSLLEVGSDQAGRINLHRFNAVQCTAEVLITALETVHCDVLDVPGTNTAPADYLAANGIDLSFSPEVQSVCLHQDKTKFEQILGNLVRNGLHFRCSRVGVRLGMKAEQLEICVYDDGPGIEPEDQEFLFKSYAHKSTKSQAQRKGHGLGLASSRILARCLGGDITIDDADGCGARFVLRLPTILDEQAAEKMGYEIQEVG